MYFKSLAPEKIIPILEKYKEKNNEYPSTMIIRRLRSGSESFFPSIRWIQDRGGIIWFYKLLGLDYTDARTGSRRSQVAIAASKKSQSVDVLFSKRLVKRYGEANVHWQSPYNKGMSLHRSDFRVYKKDGKSFFIDLFFPRDIESLIGCVNIKLRKLKEAQVSSSIPIYFVSCNEECTNQYYIDKYIENRKSPLPENVRIFHLPKAYSVLDLYSMV